MDSIESIKEHFNKTSPPIIISPSEIIDKIVSLLPLIKDFLENIPNNNFYKEEHASNINDFFNIDLPEFSNSWDNILEFMKNEIIPRFPSVSNPHFLGYVLSSPSPPAIIGALLTPIFNQFVGIVVGSPGGSAIEALVIKWIIELLDLDSSGFGSFTMGGSGANLTCIYIGLVDKAPWNILKEGLSNNKRLMIYTSDQSHNYIMKVARLLGLGEDSIKIIPSNSSFCLTPEVVRNAIEEDETDSRKIPVMIVATAGTTNTGSIDDLEGLLKLAHEKNLWFHVDGAYGAFAKITSTNVSKELTAIKWTDSIALDAHKWLFASFEAGIAIVKDSKKLKQAFDLRAEYLKDTELEEDYFFQRNFHSYGFPLSRELRGLKLWFLIQSFGKQGLSQLITRNILVADYLRKRVDEHPNSELMADGKLSIVCFRWIGSDEMNERIITRIQQRKKFYLSRTTLKGKIVLRVCILNFYTTPELMDELIEEIETIFKEQT